MEKHKVEQRQLIQQILNIGHGDLNIYVDVGLAAAHHESELLAHLIAWNAKKGEVRDSKVALPVLALRGPKDTELQENAVAHLCQLSPRDLLRACYFNRKGGKTENGSGKMFKAGVVRYLREREQANGWWDRTALQHRVSLKGLYALNHVKPSSRAQKILFERLYPESSIFTKVKTLKDMSPVEAAGTILQYKIPFLVAVGALGGLKGKPDVLLALIERMTGNELITNAAMLEKSGVMDNPALRAAFEAALERARNDKRTGTMKAAKAAKASKTSKVAAKMDALHEKKLSQTGGIEGNWLVLGDKSGSMSRAIEVAKHVAALIAQQVTGKVHLVFFDTRPYGIDVSGKTMNEIEQATKRIAAGGGTSIGCGLDLMLQRSEEIHGIVVCSDGGENESPYFAGVYEKYVAKMVNEPTVYLFHTHGDLDRLTLDCKRHNIQMERFELGVHVDYYSLPNLIKTIRTNRYSLVDEIMATPLLTMDEVFKTKEMAA